MTPEEKREILADVDRACKVMQEGGIVVYPTDTIWGIGCDATNADAVARVYEIKRRADHKALITLVPDAGWVERYVEEVPDVAWELLDVAVDPMTIVYDRGKNVATNLMGEDGSIGLRVTSEFYSRELCRRLRKPVVSSSANVSGDPSPMCFAEISKEILDAADYVAMYRRDDKGGIKASTVIRLGAGGLIKILRS
jgi:L-threonylcarbamoyladenylate synthase